MKYWKLGNDVFAGDYIEGAIELTEEEFGIYQEEKIGIAIRARRNTLLKEVVDSVNPMRWEAMTDIQKDAWRAYRQALLDVPQQEGFPMTIVWPIAPEV
jgi:hypothetical protein